MRILLIFVVALVIAGLGIRFCVEKVPVDSVGVKIRQLGGGGAVQEDFAPGYVFCVPGIHRLELMDPTLQFFTIADDGETGAPLALRSSDQYVTKVDVTVVYRLKKGEAHRALVRHGRAEAFKTKLRSFANKNIWEELAKLETEDFYNPAKRLEGSLRAKDRMNRDLADQHMEVIDVLVRNVEYDPNFEQKLLDKQILDQKQQLETSKAILEGEKEKTELIEKETEAKTIAIAEDLKAEVNLLTAETDAEVAQIEADTDLFTKQLMADADNYERQRTAEGELLKTKAQAKGEKAITEAYAGFGGKLYLTRQLLDNLEIGEIEINTNRVNPFDVYQMLEMLGVEAAEISEVAKP